MANKVKYGLNNVYYAVQNEADDGTVTYEKPVRWPGAVNLSLDAQGDVNNFYADDSVYFKSVSNNGYEGDLESALIPDSFRTDVLGEVMSSTGIMSETTDTHMTYFALLFEFNGDKSKTRHCLYNCAATRPEIASQTVEDSIEPVTETVTISNSALANGWVHAKTTDDITEEAYNSWYDEVPTPWDDTDISGNTEP